MRTFDDWMTEYSTSHNHPTNKLIHKIAVPFIMLSVLGIFWCIPTPEAFKAVSPWMNWATIFAVGSLCFYFILNKVMFFSMLVTCTAMLMICNVLDQQGVLLQTSVIIFVLAWIAQFYGHKLEGKKPSFMKDLVFLLIGPLWVMRALFAQFGLKV